MLSFVQNWFASAANPIGVDFGTECLRMAQVQMHLGEPRLFAAASADVPAHMRKHPEARAAFFTEAAKELLSTGNFHGRQAILALPASATMIHHLRLRTMDDAQTKKAIPQAMRGMLAIEPDDMLIRHFIAGQVQQQSELILMAAHRAGVELLLNAARKARLDIIGMDVEPKALMDCFAHSSLRSSDANVTDCFVDMGSVGTRVTIARAGQILLARSIELGGERFTEAVAHAMGISSEEAKLLQLKVCHGQAAFDEQRDKRELYSGHLHEAARSQATADFDRHRTAVEAACQEPLTRLIEHLSNCRHYLQSTFAGADIERLVFVGGEGRNRWLCQSIARAMDIAAQVGDPLIRMGRQSDIGFESGIDRRQPQPAWAVAIGLSLGPASPRTSSHCRQGGRMIEQKGSLLNDRPELTSRFTGSKP